ncbi:MAG TPA: PTS sugar transporter subunit IIC [Candidatus Mediterraneibacter merdavium]|nr:PTS sugar transporter subunit IIC [Candidatus Mediterraneibacter merdavium]
MLVNALIVGFVLAFAKFIDWWGNTMLSRPIFIVAMLGAMLGHPTEGIILAAQLELVFLGNVSLGGVMPTDFTMGAIFGGAFAMLLGEDLATAVMLAVPLAALGTLLYSAMKVVVTALVPKFEQLIRDKKIGSFKALWIAQFAGFHICYFLLGFLCILLGTDVIQAFVEIIPDWVQASMTVASTMLPALGMALLMKSLWSKEVCPYYFLGFGLGAFLLYNATTAGTITEAAADAAIQLTTSSTKILSLTQIAFMGAVIAALVIFSELRKIKEKESMTAMAKTMDESEDFFND